jgi:purine-binding chemotaxis protein CheW
LIGYVTFTLADRELACRLDEVREVVRLSALDALPGMVAPITGILELRGNPLPVVDLRTGTGTGTGTGSQEAAASRRGDVLVLATGVEAVGVIVDRVTAVRDDDELVSLGEDRPSGLPGYVVEVLRRPGRPEPVLLVDLRLLLTVAA